MFLSDKVSLLRKKIYHHLKKTQSFRRLPSPPKGSSSDMYASFLDNAQKNSNNQGEDGASGYFANSVLPEEKREEQIRAGGEQGSLSLDNLSLEVNNDNGSQYEEDDDNRRYAANEVTR